VEITGTFHLKGNTGLQIDHLINDQGELSIEFFGGMIVRHGDRFDRYLARLEGLEHLASEAAVTHIHCHLEHLGEVLSRAQHAIYRMLAAMREQGRPVTIYATGEHPEQSEHLKMSRLFVAGLSKQPGAPVKLVELRRAS
jgi:hypothetical protein